MANAFPDIHVTGAVHHWVKTREMVEPYYLGTAEITPLMVLRQYFTESPAPVAGGTLAYQRTYDGQAATVSVLLSRFSKITERMIRAAGGTHGDVQIDPIGTTAESYNPGTETRWSRGGLAFGSRDFELWQVFDFAGEATVESLELEVGWYWPQVTVDKTITVAAGTQVEKLLLVFDCQPQYQTAADILHPTGNERGWVLYSTDESDFPESVLEPQ